MWDKTLARLEKEYTELQPTVLLAFIARFKGSVIQDEMFRLTAFGMAVVEGELGAVDVERMMSSRIRLFLKV